MSDLAQIDDAPAIAPDGTWLIPLTFAGPAGGGRLLLTREHAAQLGAALLMAAAGVFPFQATPEGRAGGLQTT